MSNIAHIESGLPVVAGVEIAVDEHGRFNLNAIHKASGTGAGKKPSEWLRIKQAQDLARELEAEIPASKILDTVKGRGKTGTFAHELLAISYAGWISPAFQLKVNRVFMDYRTGKLQTVAVPATLSEALRLAADQAERIEIQSAQILEFKPKAEFYDQVASAPDAISVGEAAKIIGTGRRRLFAFMRQHGWVTRRNEPYQIKIEQGYLDVKLGSWEHPDHGIQQSVTALVTGKGLTRLQKLWAEPCTKNET
jgi:phage antirepressor YoqD-like protein